MSAIKINRALRLADVGRYPASAAAMLAAIPAEVIAALSARHVASILDANWDLAQEAKALAEAAAIDNGIIWDARRQVSREIV